MVRPGTLLPVAAALACAAVVTIAASASASAPRVETLVVGKGDRVVRGPRVVTATQRTLAAQEKGARRVRRCAIPAGTPIAALAALRPAGLRLVDYGTCSRRARDAGGLYVERLAGDVARGADGWVYKVGRSVRSTGGADLASRLRSGARLIWFYCRTQVAGGCQSTLELTYASPPAGPFAVGTPVPLVVRAYDDRGKGVAVGGATVTIAGVTATSRPDGSVSVTPPFAGRFNAAVTAPGLVRSFGLVVSVA